jgi:hypothetical protein
MSAAGAFAMASSANGRRRNLIFQSLIHLPPVLGKTFDAPGEPREHDGGARATYS